MRKIIFALIVTVILGGCVRYENGKPVDSAEPAKEEKKVEEATEPTKETKKEEVKTENKEQKESQPVSLEDKVKSAVHKAFGKENDFNKKDSILELNYNKDLGYILVRVYGSDNFSSNMIKKGMWMDVESSLKKLKEEKDIQTIEFNIVFPMEDQYGNSSDDNVMKLSLSRETLDKINWANFDYNNLPNVADEYWEHPAFSKK